MNKIKSLNNYQKAIVLIMIGMALTFAVIYPKIISKVGYRYNDAILVPENTNEGTVYSGKIDGEQAEFVVSENMVGFRYGEKNYGEYIVKEEPGAVPKDREMKEQMLGIEITNNDEIIFRGGVLDFGDNNFYLYNEDGTMNDFGFAYIIDAGVEMDLEGNPIDKMEPSPSVIYELLNGPQLTHKGDARAWFGGMFVCILNALSIIFADELFRFNLAFMIRDVENAEPSEWELTGRYIGWTVITIMALVVFITGLQ